MKVLLLLFLVGFAAASFHEQLEDAADDAYLQFLLELENADDDNTDDIAKRLRETFDDILEKIKDSIDQGKGVKEDLMNKLKEIREKMKDLKVDLGNKAKELLKKIKDRVKDFWQKILDKLKDVKEDTTEAEIQMANFNIKEMFKKLKEQLLSKIDKEKLKSKIEEIFGKGSEMADNILKVINEKGDKYKQKLLDLVDRFLKKEEEKRSLYEFAEDDDDTKTELGKRMKKTLDEILEKIKDSIAQGKGVKEDLMNKLKDIREKMRDLKIDIGKKARELLDKVKDRVSNFWKEILDKLKDIKDDKETSEAEVQRADLKEMFKKLKKQILSKIDKEKLKAKIEEIFGKGSEMADSLLRIVNEKGEKFKQKLLDLVDRYLDDKEKRSVKEMWEKVKDYFKNLQIDLKEKYMKFGEWVKTVADKALKKGQDKMTNIKSIAKEFVDHAKGVSKEVAVEALEFLKPYKEDLGALWDQVKVAVKDIVQKKDD